MPTLGVSRFVSQLLLIAPNDRQKNQKSLAPSVCLPPSSTQGERGQVGASTFLEVSLIPWPVLGKLLMRIAPKGGVREAACSSASAWNFGEAPLPRCQDPNLAAVVLDSGKEEPGN